ncbi:hypothetical protein HGA91_01890 [candidate division WWE3 bacterium]|nr:hypothetical protein [candidate division WWE3 bacterium]
MRTALADPSRLVLERVFQEGSVPDLNVEVTLRSALEPTIHQITINYCRGTQRVSQVIKDESDGVRYQVISSDTKEPVSGYVFIQGQQIALVWGWLYPRLMQVNAPISSIWLDEESKLT